MMARRKLLVIAVLFLFAVLVGFPTSASPADTSQDNHFTIIQGTIIGGAQPVSVTIRLDARTGAASILRQRTDPGFGGKTHIEWAPIEEFGH